MNNIINGVVTSSKSRIAIVVSRTNKAINKNLLSGAIDTLTRIGNVNIQNIFTIWVPGAYEFPLTVSLLAKKKKYDAIIVLGTIIQGETLHFKFIYEICNQKISDISIQYNIPITSGILITKNISQAVERSGVKLTNRGTEAALSALEMINVLINI